MFFRPLIIDVFLTFETCSAMFFRPLVSDVSLTLATDRQTDKQTHFISYDPPYSRGNILDLRF